MGQRTIVITLALLIVALAGIGAWCHDPAIPFTLAAIALTGTFAYLQVRKDQP
jgi:hypothetical protein